ncbi:hypothetical protein IWX75_002352 [Arthrobacter sp. CAN_A6]|uniref:SSI family serine proteinase inhibitor n=1 Tax=Arthrobacter sp. CAN_A6 TaxID=2787721 RepID=UPI0018CACF24
MDRVHRQPARIGRPGLALAAVAVHIALVSCGGDPGATPAEPTPPSQESVMPPPAPAPPSQESTMPSPVPPSSAASTEATTLLTVEIRQSETAEPVEYVLECSGDASGPNTTLPNADEACATVQSLGADFFNALPNTNVVCTQQYGGPQTASISGTVNGTQVRARFALTDGCEILRWNAVRGILGAGGAA